jgi:superfamily II DNA or RNA helicase
VLGESQVCVRLGGITLRPHQQSAVARAEAALEEFGGVLICDDVGMGKTFVATAIARRFSRSLVIAPAALASMWQDALATTQTRADFLTFERLSRSDVALATCEDYDLVIVDEAHHVRNPATRRYHHVAKLARDVRVLLLTATPIHNRTTDVSALLSLFLGSRARTLTTSELARCVLRREHGTLGDDIAIPRILPTQHRQVSDDPSIVQDLMDLPPPLPVRDGGLGGALIGRGLVHQWASSEAALSEALRRRIAKAAALAASLESGNYPTARELETWTYGDGALQLGFPELLSSPTEDADALLDSVRTHSDALQKVHARQRAGTVLDAERAEILLEIRRAHPTAKIVAFAQYAETVSMLFTRLSTAGGVAVLTARGGLVAGGKLARDEALARFAPLASRAHSPPLAERIDFLLTTDLLSEGVNLQDAEVVVHLDVPWTAARMDQRVGRVARMGSPHSRVHVYVLRPPASAAAVLGGELLVQRKWAAAKRAIGSSVRQPLSLRVDAGEESSALDSVPAKTERLRAILERWHCPLLSSDSVDVFVTSVRSPQAGFVAAVSVEERRFLLCSVSGRVSADIDSQIAACLLCEGAELSTNPDDYEAALTQIQSWFARELASAAAGVGGSHATARKRILSRLDSAIQNAPPHIRAVRSRVAARARNVATRQHGAAIEAELEVLTNSPLPDYEWLEALARLESARPAKQSVPPPAAAVKIHALLLMRGDLSAEPFNHPPVDDIKYVGRARI